MSDQTTPVLRFPPSPTGFLHIGGARTALFNWLYARHTRGVFRLRIEDTDRERSTPAAVDAILKGLDWLGLHWDGEVVYQFSRAERHREVAERLLGKGLAYRCYATPEELEAMRQAQRAAGKPVRYDGRWRDRDPSEGPHAAPFVVRIKAQQTGETVVNDVVLGDVRFANDQLDDMILLRSDGTPTYMLAVVVDDHDMGVNHVIRGADHLNNTARQLQIVKAMDWSVPVYGHLPLINGPDGTKLSKRHGALAVEAYRDMGYLPEAMRNYLARLGWSHGDDEIFSTEQAIEWFDLQHIQKSPARFDFKKLDSLNAHYIRQSDVASLVEKVAAIVGDITPTKQLDANARERLRQAMPGLKERARTLVELAQGAEFLFTDGRRELDAAAEKVLDADARRLLSELLPELSGSSWTPADLEECVRGFAVARGLKLGQVAQPIRAAITGKAASPPIFEVLAILGREESLSRLMAYAA